MEQYLNLHNNMTEFNKEKPLRVFESFAGYGSQSMALNRVKQENPEFDFEVVGISEIEKNALKAYEAIHGHCPNYGDISKINWEEVPDFDLFTYSFPCFTKGTLVLTEQGFKNIEDITNNDSVITHTNQFRKVVSPMCKKYKGLLYKINAMPFDELICTPEHPFYIRKLSKVWDNSKRVYNRVFTKPQWICAKELDKTCYVGVAINQKNELPKWDGVIDNRWGHNKKVNNLTELFENTSFWYLMGRYVGDGWKKQSNIGNGIIICCGGRNEDKLIKSFEDTGFKPTICNEKTVRKYIISSNELNEFVNRYGYYAHGKKVDAETMNLPIDLLESFIDGYIDSDGYCIGNLNKISSVSRELIYGIAQCVAKVYHRPYSIYKYKRKPQTVIEGRVVNQRDSYSITFKLEKGKQDKAFYEDGYIWCPINRINQYEDFCDIYNMEVEIDNSYTANGCIVHNCTDISHAGKQMGLSEGSGTRSGLLWECRKAIDIKRPKYLLMENVKALTGKKFIGEFEKWLKELEEFGYTSYWEVMNAKNHGVPQNRERVFCLSILGDHEPFVFPKEEVLDKRLKDVLEPTVEDKFVLSDRAVEGLFNYTENFNSNKG